MMLDIETKLYIDAKGLPTIEILSVSFLPVAEFYVAVDNNEEYLIVAIEDEGMNHIGVNKHGNAYLIGLDRPLYVANSLVKFIKQLLAFQSFNSKERTKNHIDELRDTIKNIDKTAIKNNETFWSTILENIEEVIY